MTVILIEIGSIFIALRVLAWATSTTFAVVTGLTVAMLAVLWAWDQITIGHRDAWARAAAYGRRVGVLEWAEARWWGASPRRWVQEAPAGTRPSGVPLVGDVVAPVPATTGGAQ